MIRVHVRDEHQGDISHLEVRHLETVQSAVGGIENWSARDVSAMPDAWGFCDQARFRLTPDIVAEIHSEGGTVPANDGSATWLVSVSLKSAIV
jgi:hypothetical protein